VSGKLEYTYIYICPTCKIEVFSTESPQHVGLREDTCMACNTKGRFWYIGSVGSKKKHYPLFTFKLAYWKAIMRIKERWKRR